MESVFFGQILAVKFDLFKNGMQVNQHKHEYDHISILTSGEVSVVVDGGPENIYTAPSVICIKRNSNHKITSRSDDTVWFCIFSLKDINGDPTEYYDSVNMPKYGSYPSGTEPVIGYLEQIKTYDEIINNISKLNLLLTEEINKISDPNLKHYQRNKINKDE